MPEFISEDDLKTFGGWLRYQSIDAATTGPEDMETWRSVFDDIVQLPKVGLMKLPQKPGVHRYAVAVRDGSDLWLTLWVLRSRRGEFFVMVPRGDGHRDVHASYHHEGDLHIKSYKEIVPPSAPIKCQPLTGVFRGTVSLGAYSGHGPKGVGAVCDPAAFSGIVEVAPGILGPRHGMVTVDLVEPGCQPTNYPWVRIAKQKVFCDILPWVVITVGLVE